MALQAPSLSFSQAKDSFAVKRPDRYRLYLPAEWKKNKLTEAITDVLSQTIDELKGRDFCTECIGGYSVKLAMDSLSVMDAQTTPPMEIGGIPHYTFSFNYSLRAALIVHDSSGKTVSMLRLIGRDEIMNYSKQFTLPPQNATYRLQNVYDNRGRVIGTRYVQEAPPMNIANPEFDPMWVLSQSFLLNICEQRVYEIKKMLKKLNQN